MDALLRYWWLVVVGFAVAIFVGVAASYAKKEPVEYTAAARMLVTSADAPYFRTSVTDTPPQTSTQTQTGGAAATRTAAAAASSTPNTAALVKAANLYPVLIESDPVANERLRLFGELPGAVQAHALFSVETANRFRESSIPVIEVLAWSERPGEAIELADRTVLAFQSWVKRQQVEAKVKPGERILIEPLSAASVVGQIGGPRYAIPTILGLAVFLSFCGLALMLDALAGRRWTGPVVTPAPRDHGSAP
jgi:hypothetical protein